MNLLMDRYQQRKRFHFLPFQLLTEEPCWANVRNMSLVTDYRHPDVVT